MSHQTVIVLDFGGQYNQLIARRVRECGVYCEVKPYTTPLAELKAMEPIGIIFTGGPNSVYDEKAPHVDPELFTWGVPILGICYGCQLMAQTLGGQVTEAQDDSAREYGKTPTYYDTACRLFKGLPDQGVSWMSHSDYMAQVPQGFALTAHSDNCPNVAIADEARGFYGVQFHPEVNHTENGVAMIRNFLYEVCGAQGDWTMGDYLKTSVAAIREKVGSGKVLLALSGGVDSSVCAALLAVATRPGLPDLLLLFALPLAAAVFTPLFGLRVNLAYPHFTWKTETEVIKQSQATMIAVLGGMGLVGVAAGLTFGLQAFLPPVWTMTGVTLAFLAASALLYRNLMTKGAAKLYTL